MLDAIDVDALRTISLVTNSSGQIEQGGRQDYTHTLSNSGNVPEVVELTSSNSQTGWTNSVSIDTDGDGIGDTNLASILPGTISVQQADTTVISVVVTDTDGDGNPELAVDPGDNIPLFASVFAPNNAALGERLIRLSNRCRQPALNRVSVPFGKSESRTLVQLTLMKSSSRMK